MSCLKSTAGHILIEYESRVWLDSIENPYWKITVFFVIQRQLAVPRCAGNDGLHLRPQWIYTLSFVIHFLKVSHCIADTHAKCMS